MTANTDWRTIGPVLLRWGNGDEESCAGIEDAVNRLQWPTVEDLVRVENEGFFAGDPVIGELIHLNERWTRVVLLDEHGLPIPAWRIMDAARAVSLEQRWRRRGWRWRRALPYVHRDGPVPRVGGRRRRYSRCHRRPGTFAERAVAALAEVDDDLLEHGVRVRARRNATNLPTSYDDVRRGDLFERSWKNSRRTQWKERRR